MGWLSDLVTAGIGYKSQQDTNKANKELSRDSWQATSDFSKSAYQTAAADLKLAGINPILAGQFGQSSTPAYNLATMKSPIEGALSGASTAKTMQDTQKSKFETASAKADAILKSNLIPASKIAAQTSNAALELIVSATGEKDLATAVKKIRQLGTKAGGDLFTWYQNIIKHAPREIQNKVKSVIQQAIHGKAAKLTKSPKPSLQRK